MRVLSRILAWLAGIVLVIVIVAYAANVQYIFKAVWVTYMHGHRTAYLADYTHFDNHIVEVGAAQPWSRASTADGPVLPDSIRAFHDSIRSVAYLVIHRDSIRFEAYFDGYDETSHSNSFSMAKSVVGAILGKVIENGDIDSIEQLVTEFVPEITGPYADRLTLKDLVTMSSGMAWDERYYSPFSITTKAYFYHDLPEAIRELPIESQPGQRFKYQSGDTQLLGIAIQRATERSLSALLADYFWKPMGAEHAAYWQVDSRESGYEKAYCCLASNARDFARFGKLYLQNGNWNGQQLLPEEYIQASLRPRFADSPQYGYSWWMGSFEEKPYFYMDGHLGQYVIVVPEDELIVVRLGHQVDGKRKNNPAASFYKFIAHAYALLGAGAASQ